MKWLRFVHNLNYNVHFILATSSLPPRCTAKRPWNLFLDDRGLTLKTPVFRTGTCFCANQNHAFQVWIALNLQFNKSIHTLVLCIVTRKIQYKLPSNGDKTKGSNRCPLRLYHNLQFIPKRPRWQIPFSSDFQDINWDDFLCFFFLIPKGQLIAYEIFKILLNTDGGKTIVTDNVLLAPFEIFARPFFVTLQITVIPDG